MLVNSDEYLLLVRRYGYNLYYLKQKCDSLHRFDLSKTRSKAREYRRAFIERYNLEAFEMDFLRVTRLWMKKQELPIVIGIL